MRSWRSGRRRWWRCKLSMPPQSRRKVDSGSSSRSGCSTLRTDTDSTWRDVAGCARSRLTSGCDSGGDEVPTTFQRARVNRLMINHLLLYVVAICSSVVLLPPLTARENGHQPATAATGLWRVHDSWQRWRGWKILWTQMCSRSCTRSGMNWCATTSILHLRGQRRTLQSCGASR